MHPRLVLSAVAAALLAASPRLPAQIVTISPEQVLRIHFTVPYAPAPSPDVLTLGLGLTSVGAAHTQRTARLWNCDYLMGTATDTSFGTYTGALSLGVANGWREVGSPYTFGNPADVVSFSTLQNASIRGIIDFQIATGSITFDLANVSLLMIRATNSGGGSVCSPQPVIQEALLGPRLAAPSPGTANAVNTWTTLGCTPGSLVVHGFGFSCAPQLVSTVPPVYFDLAGPIISVMTTTPANGHSAVSFNVPSFAVGVTLRSQSVELTASGLRVSNFVRHTF